MTKRDCLVTVHNQAQLPAPGLPTAARNSAPEVQSYTGSCSKWGPWHTYATGKFLRQSHRGKGTALPHQDVVLS